MSRKLTASGAAAPRGRKKAMQARLAPKQIADVPKAAGDPKISSASAQRRAGDLDQL